MFDAGRSPSTVRRVATVLHKVFEDARRGGLVGQNPVDYSDPPQNARFELRLWSDEQVRLFLGEARKSSRLYPLYLAAIDTGARIGELLSCTWDNFNPFLQALSIRQTLTRPRGGGIIFGFPKSASSLGDIDVSPEVAEALEDLRARQTRERHARQVCPNGLQCGNARVLSDLLRPATQLQPNPHGPEGS